MLEMSVIQSQVADWKQKVCVLFCSTGALLRIARGGKGIKHEMKRGLITESTTYDARKQLLYIMPCTVLYCMQTIMFLFNPIMLYRKQQNNKPLFCALISFPRLSFYRIP